MTQKKLMKMVPTAEKIEKTISLQTRSYGYLRKKSSPHSLAEKREKVTGENSRP
jgi:hypothetical protein